MHKLCSLVFLLLIQATAASAEPPNVLLLCVDDLRPELNCFGKSYIESPNIDRLAKSGVTFEQHYVQAPTCGASRYAMLTGTYGPAGNHALFQRAERVAKDPATVPPSMPAWFRERGYTTVSVGKVSHHPGGRGGRNWDDESIPEMPNSWDRHLMPSGPWQHPRGIMHGLANGEIRGDAKAMDVYQSTAGGDDIYPDGQTTEEALRQLDALAADEESPFFLAVGIIRPHLPFGAPAKYMAPYADVTLPPIEHPEKPSGKTTWHRSGEFMKYNRGGKDPNTDSEFATAVRKHYAACVSYADAQVGQVLDRLEQSGQADNTIVVLWGDHGWHLGEHAIWGKHALFDESLRSPLVIRYPEMDEAGTSTDAIVESIDIFPTLCRLAGLPTPEFLDGGALVPVGSDTDREDHGAISYKSDANTIRTSSFRLIRHKNGFLELYDHRSNPDETNNVAATQQEVAERLVQTMQSRLASPQAEQGSGDQ
ncbi:sulfatase [Allorhodopirellula solitaria]|uniref:Arylsulfatase n=1 Tax=Allorhodopirellula solitaria TaxID=2527987 RepID=A0A5C5XXK8_9BACT|nr:sulfatase [Allorhodopirellula solitaria]TWT67231.1 Arylsulfatase [Allorhodopirellula solitaria]